MRRGVIFSVVALVGVMLYSSCSSVTTDSSANREAEGSSLTKYVDPFIGTGGHGHTFPGAAFPFGQIQLSPDNATAGWDWVSGYHDRDSTIVGFSHLHLSGTGIGDLCDLSIMPTSKSVDLTKPIESNASFISEYMGLYKKSGEVARPGYYSVDIWNQNIKAEMTVSERVGMHRYSFEKDGGNSIILNLGYAKNWDRATECDINLVDDNLVTGVRKSTGWAEDQHLYFAIEFSEPVALNGVVSIGDDASNKVGVFSVDSKDVMLKVAISSVSVEGAVANLKSENIEWDFDAVAKAADSAWNVELAKFKVETESLEKMRIFYTALYHTKISPALFSDTDGKFKGVDGSVQVAEGYNRYTIFSLWDTYRTLHPLYTLTDSERVNDMVKSMMDHYRQSGALPIWELEGNETGCMVGNHSISVIAEAIVKGIGDFDTEEAFEAMKVTSMSEERGIGYHDKLGYIPSDVENESVSKALEYMVDDWAVAAAAKKLGRDDDYSYFLERSKRYVNYWDESTQFFRGKMKDGSWRTPFIPTESVHRDNDYVEGNAWQYLWLVPQDPEGLIELFGSKEKFTAKLDRLFTLEEGLTGGAASPDITGLIGAYAHGNEPGHHTAYLYNSVGEYGKCADIISQIYSEMYKDDVDGLAGNEDCGQMSAWYVMSSLGFYPVNPASAEYQFGLPLFDKVTIELADGKTMVVKSDSLSSSNRYIKEVYLNGNRLDRSYVTHKEIVSGGELRFVMSSTPSDPYSVK